MKGVLLHGGAGTRLRPLTFTGPKQLIPVANKPVSQYCLEDMIGAGIKEVAIILGETYPEMVEEHYGDGSRFGCKITYIHQGKPLGIAHAVYLAKDFVGDEKFVVYLGDNLIQDGIKEYVKRFDEEDFDAFILLKEVEDPRAFGVAKFEGERLVGLIEKPKEPPSNYAVIGVYMFKPVVFDIIKDLKPSWRGELEITDTLQKMIENGYNVGYAKLKGWWFDTGKAEDILKVNATILDERAKRSVKGEVLASQIEGRVEVGEGAKITNSIVRGPAVIGEDCIIENSFIGPYTSVGERTVIKNSSLEYCIVLSESIIEGVERIEESLIGRKVRIRKNDRKRFLRFTIGDYSEILL
ncbi:glucose-1-phosphate thymidylyltransferase [Archaeoglobus fulgidus]|uniref:Glucose-1-phosphate thymidylyltransferase (GraD-2) n=2 Tax=Archaeoglobus fulgidus TaxID=2234 RepID=O29921_ARCFU|nr:glucose-1-phosphate thymidylyltransferase [Archaeoglobus fulgidus]AAB90910.1 glucose-1-phosphate thymidylyltransferase (graD-2) [Archaeoglobus fulgidus DSM 4304]AIG97146.1 glucose-1-phosphate thymidylylransferase, long form [Archaeoglobus fulgidus DSM 8774]